MESRINQLPYALTFWGTLLGIIFTVAHKRNTAGIIFSIIGYGGLGIAYSEISQHYRKRYSDMRAFIDLSKDIINKHPPKQSKKWVEAAIIHLPQALLGSYLLLKSK